MIHREKCPRFRQERQDMEGISLGSWSRMSSCRRSSILLWWMKLPLFSLSFVDWDSLCLTGWSCSLLNLAIWFSSLKSPRSSGDWSPVIVSSSIIGVDFMAPVMMRVACFCTLLTRSKLDLAVVPYAVMPYSSTGLTLPMYSLLRVTVSAPHVVPANFFMRASRTLTLASAFSACFHVSRLSRVTPR